LRPGAFSILRETLLARERKLFSVRLASRETGMRPLIPTPAVRSPASLGRGFG